MSKIKRTVAVILTAGCIGSAIALAPAAEAETAGTATPRTATSCYGDAHSYAKADGNAWYPGNGSWLHTTSSCSDINIKPNTDRYVAVCWVTTKKCQGTYTLAPAGQWTAVATDVLDGTTFYFVFRSTAYSSGYWAA
ncbi:hypothetical protein AB0L59_15865 [Streptomyces sp. NPDC052109]|uniref:hypothetical protein n=1 Tax=Streptomyces sp. NPDC052109 TaxID=3155527 RepID=UPI0034325919